MKTLYLHIGIPKTASTAIQLFCMENEKALNDHGYIFPDFGLHYRFTGEWRNGHFLIGEQRVKSEKANYEKKDQVIDTCFEKIYQLFETYDHMILSDEGLWYEGVRNDGRIWKKIQAEAEKGIFSIKVIVYLRRQDEFIYSRWNQQIKAAFGLDLPNYVRSWEETLEHIPKSMLNYYEILKKISAYVGKENIIVRQFDRKRFYKQNVYADFLNAVGLEFSEEFHIQQETPNVSLTRNNIEIKRILNGLPDLDGENSMVFRTCLTQLSEQPFDDGKYSMFSEEEMHKFMSKYEKGNRKVAEEYLGIEEDLFDVAYKAEKKWTRENPRMMDDIVRFTGSVALHLLRENQELKKELADQRRMIEEQKSGIAQLKQLLKHPINMVKKKVKGT